MLFGDFQNGSRFHIFRQMGTVQDTSPALVKFLHRLDFLCLLRFGQIVNQRSYLSEFNGRDFHNR